MKGSFRKVCLLLSTTTNCLPACALYYFIMNDGGYSAKNGAREAPQHRLASSGSTLGVSFLFLIFLSKTALMVNFYLPFHRMISPCYVKHAWGLTHMFV